MTDFDSEYESDRGQIRGAILTEPISALGPRTPVVVQPGVPIREAAAQMASGRTGCVCVVEREVLVGIFTERDLLAVVQDGVDTSSMTVGERMTPKPETLRPEHGIAVALNRMSEGGFRHIPLVDDRGRPAGIVAMRDIVRFIVSLFPDAVLTAPPNPTAIPTEYGG